MHVLDRYFPEWPRLYLHESSPGAAYLTRWCAGYSSSQLLAGVEPGQEQDGVRCENVEHLTFASDEFDIFITQDVLEHVFDPAQAVGEIMRVVRPGGAHVFTTPKHRSRRASQQRATLEHGEVVYLASPEYHGNPVGDGRSLVTWDYGDDFESLVSLWSGYPVTTFVTRDRDLGLDGEYLEVFVARKFDRDAL